MPSFSLLMVSPMQSHHTLLERRTGTGSCGGTGSIGKADMKGSSISLSVLDDREAEGAEQHFVTTPMFPHEGQADVTCEDRNRGAVNCAESPTDRHCIARSRSSPSFPQRPYTPVHEARPLERSHLSRLNAVDADTDPDQHPLDAQDAFCFTNRRMSSRTSSGDPTCSPAPSHWCSASSLECRSDTCSSSIWSIQNSEPATARRQPDEGSAGRVSPNTLNKFAPPGSLAPDMINRDQHATTPPFPAVIWNSKENSSSMMPKSQVSFNQSALQDSSSVFVDQKHFKSTGDLPNLQEQMAVNTNQAHGSMPCCCDEQQDAGASLSAARRGPAEQCGGVQSDMPSASGGDTHKQTYYAVLKELSLPRDTWV